MQIPEYDFVIFVHIFDNTKKFPMIHDSKANKVATWLPPIICSSKVEPGILAQACSIQITWGKSSMLTAILPFFFKKSNILQVWLKPFSRLLLSLPTWQRICLVSISFKLLFQPVLSYAEFNLKKVITSCWAVYMCVNNRWMLLPVIGWAQHKRSS